MFGRFFMIFMSTIIGNAQVSWLINAAVSKKICTDEDSEKEWKIEVKRRQNFAYC